ncbi:MAG: S-layer homology domain-containing protein [Clostridia bacterium]|nr:S-layer homology domain-containing protein [Clostridia bacterium]
MFRFQRICALPLVILLAVSMILPASAADSLTDTGSWLQKKITAPAVASVGGEWAVIGLARSDIEVPQNWYDSYYNNVVTTVKACGGVLHKRKYTEYSRVVLALTAIGKDPANVAGYNLLNPLSDFDATVWQGVNGAIWALIALDSGSYVSTVRQDYVDHIAAHQLSCGGWALSGETPDTDLTAMALQALAGYRTQPAVKRAVDRALSWLSKTQNADGSFSVEGIPTCESTAQVLVAMGALGMDPEDSRFVKNGCTAEKALLSFYTAGKGFSHARGGGTDGMATEQAFYALVSLRRQRENRPALYDICPFADLNGHPNRKAILSLYDRGIANGMGDGSFSPDATMTRAQFCTMVSRALELKPTYRPVFSDVKQSDWYGGWVSAANANGIVNGVGSGRFDPEGTIIGQHAALMVNRAAAVLGVSHTAVNSSAKPIRRCEMAQMVFDLLEAAK